MSRLSTISTLVAFACVAVLGGCYVESAPPNTVEEPVASPPPPPPPPAARPEPPPPPRGKNQVWIKGHYRWSGENYQWQKGHYERSPRPSARYVQGHWEKRNGRQKWVSDHWQ